MIGHGRPTPVLSLAVHMLTAALVVSCAASAAADEIDVRLRFAWGSGAQARQKWFGAISGAGVTIDQLQPLGIEPDEAAALRLVDNQVIVSPLGPRAFDGCDVTLRGDEAALVTIELHNASAADAKELQVPLGKLAAEQFRAPLDDLGGFLLVHRAPGDALRVRFQRDHLVFAPGESFNFTVQPDLGSEAADAPLTLDAKLHAANGGDVLWEASHAVDATTGPISLDLPVPAAEGAYRLSLSLRRPVGFTSKLTPWQQQAPAAERDVEFVVIDPKARLPRLTDAWESVQTIDPTSSKWWQRVPDWTQLDRLPGLSAPRSLGNVKPLIRREASGAFVELPTPAPGADASWQAYPLSVREVGQPHSVEIELPASARQQLAISIIEPDAAGRVLSFGREAGVYVDGGLTPSADGSADIARHRIVFWPRTASPLLLLVNHSPARPAEYGTIRLSRRSVDEAPEDPQPTAPIPGRRATGRLTAAYISAPRLADSLGAAEQLDPASGLSVDGWGTFLDAARRLAQEVRAAGYNAAVVSIAADGASLAVVDSLGSSPRYDSGLMSASGADPIRKDVLEALLRVFDREGLRLIPALELVTPLPKLETLRRAGDARATGLECVAYDGRTWNEHFPGDATAVHYNVLDSQVQAALAEVVDDLLARYGKHESLAGVALQLSGGGFGVLPGVAWGLDDATVRRFRADTGVELPENGDDRFQRRAQTLTGPQLARWTQWRQAVVTQFYANLAQRLSRDRAELQLVLCTENLFNGPEASERVRQAVSGRASLNDAAAEFGLDLDALAGAPGVCLLRPRRLASDEALEGRALDLQLNSAVELDHAIASQPQSGELFFHTARRLRLASFDAQSPFGSDKTYLTLMMASYPTGPAARRPLATALAGRDFLTLVEGAELLPLVADAESTRLRRIFQQLPGADAEVRLERRQPVIMRVYRTGAATTVCLINESPWEVDVELPLDASEPTPWSELGFEPDAASAKSTDSPPIAGSRPPGADAWRLTLPPYGIAARRYETRGLRIGALVPKAADAARAALGARIVDIEQRMHSLDVERPYQQLQNPDFELVSADGRMLGWQPRIGQAGAVATDESAAHAGVRALHLRSEDNLGVAAQSHLFPIPSTGQLLVRARVRVSNMTPGAHVYAWVEYDGGGVIRRLHRALAGPQAGAAWITCEETFDDLPLASAGQMRVQFHLAGRGEAWVDGVELFDLRFANAQRMELVKRLYAAKTALDEGQLVDCQRLVDGYWPRYLVEYLPPKLPSGVGPGPVANIATRPDDAPSAVTPPASSPGDEEPVGIGGRVRKALPRIWR